MVNDKSNEESLNLILKSYNHNAVIYLYYLYKYNIILLNTFNIFKHHGIYDKYAVVIIYVFNYFYLNDKNFNIVKLLKYMKRESLISTILKLFGEDINILNYVINNLVKKSLIDATNNMFRIPVAFPLNTLIDYSSKFYKPNKLYLNFPENKNIELLFNAAFTDRGLKALKDKEIKIYYSPKFIYFTRYNFDFERINYSTLNLKNKMDMDGHSFTNNDFEENKDHIDNFTNDYDLNFDIKEVYNIDVPDDIFSNSNESKIEYIVNKVDNFIEKYYNDECSTDFYYPLKEDYYSSYYEDFNNNFTEIIEYCDINYDIFPFYRDILGYDELEYLIEKQFSAFNEKILSNTDDGDNLIVNVLNNPECIFNYIEKYK